MCRTPEEAAWTLLSETAETRETRVLGKVLKMVGKSYVEVDVFPNIPSNARVVKITCEFLVSNELWDAIAKEVDVEPSLVG